MKRDAEESPRFFLGEGIDLVTVFHAVCYQQGRCLSKEHVWAFFRWLLGAEEAEFHTARSLLWQKGAGLQRRGRDLSGAERNTSAKNALTARAKRVTVQFSRDGLSGAAEL